MIDTDPLLTLAEISMSLAALSGLVAVFLARDRLNYLDRFRFSMIIAIACTNTLCAFVPVWVQRHAASATPAEIWQTSALLCLIVGALVAVALAASVRRVARFVPSDVGVLRRLIEPLVFTCAGVLLVLNAVGWPLTPNATFHELFIVLGLFEIALLFESLVVIRPIDDGSA